ncbi:RHS repeat domain-containing protein [Ferruginibacter sp.]
MRKSDYYPFGMSMPGRKFSAGSDYRYGFNGKENDKDAGEGVQDYGMRIYDARLGRFLSVDPLTKKFAFYTPYQFAGNKVIWCIDLDGLEDIPSTELNKYGEKQVYKISVQDDFIDADIFGNRMYHDKKIEPKNATPATSKMTDIEVYQLAFNRFVEPGKHLINSNQYIDERLMKADQQVEYFFTHQVPTYSKSNVASRTIHAIIAASLFHGNNKQDAVNQIQKSDDFLYRHDIATLIVAAAPIGAALNIRSALATLAKIQTRSLELLANGYKAGWAAADLTGAIEKFVGKNAEFEVSETGKIIWKSASSDIQVIQDPLNKYFRIQNIKLPGRRTYLDTQGNVPNNKVVNGRTTGNSQDEYNQLTHFNY